MTDNLKERLLKLCNGHPNATVPWPHRVIHDALASITDLEARLAAAEACNRGLVRLNETLQHRAETAEAGEDALAEALRRIVTPAPAVRAAAPWVYGIAQPALAAYEARRG